MVKAFVCERPLGSTPAKSHSVFVLVSVRGIILCVNIQPSNSVGVYRRSNSEKVQIALWKLSPCLAAGNTMVYKPSEFTPLHGQTLAQIFAEAGLPPGVFNVVQGAGDVGAYLTSHADVAKVSFTGQVGTGKAVAAAAGKGMKYATMELGGKSPLIVLEDVDVESAVDVS